MVDYVVFISILTRISLRIKKDKPLTLYITAADVSAVGFLQLDFLQKSVLLWKREEQSQSRDTLIGLSHFSGGSLSHLSKPILTVVQADVAVR